ncbi:MAG: bifunctional folylpolyglutamate synthase/dihydrofolate synthase [Verrucomicrobiota bacterium]|nr:bifunctional folylpolyglutamate synthase/dihydrofolate synthase [Verrucomicrobiota bacterium]
MTYREALAWLFGTQLFGIKLGLENVHRLLRALNLLDDQKFIHVAGTNGKGSVCAMIDSILRAQGYRSGLFTSPHLITFRERIQVNGEMIGETQVANGLTSIRELISNWEPHPTFFEITTALALQHFKSARCEFVALETGMGGRLDATNAITPIVSVITPIDYDHQNWLGNSLGEIAEEKAGIIKPHVPVISSPQLAEAEIVIRTRARECDAPIEFVSLGEKSNTVALPGSHQGQNAAVAIAALRAAKISVSDQAIRGGLTNVNWPARFQHWNERIVIDGAHNSAGAHVLVETWRETFGTEKAGLILGVMRDKNVEAIFRELEPIAEVVILTTFRGERVLPAEEAALIVKAIAPEKEIAIANSCAAAILAAESSPRILVTGSLHLAGEMLAHLRGTPSAFDECAQ